MSAPDADRVERYRETIRAAMEEPLEHDSCGCCGDENELDWRPLEREFALAYAAMALADKEHARLIAEVEALRRVVRRSGESLREADEDRAEVAEYRAKKFAPMSRIHRAERVAENAVADKRAAEAERDRLRISPDHLEEMLGIDPNDPLNKLARYGVEQRRRAEDAEAALAKVAELHRRVEGEHFDYCAECDEREEWPCPTAAALQADDAALMTLAEARVSTDDGVRHDLDDVAREFGVTE